MCSKTNQMYPIFLTVTSHYYRVSMCSNNCTSVQIATSHYCYRVSVSSKTDQLYQCSDHRGSLPASESTMTGPLSTLQAATRRLVNFVLDILQLLIACIRQIQKKGILLVWIMNNYSGPLQNVKLYKLVSRDMYIQMYNLYNQLGADVYQGQDHKTNSSYLKPTMHSYLISVCLLELGISHKIIVDHWRNVTDRLSIIIDYVNYITFTWNLIKRKGFYSKVI